MSTAQAQILPGLTHPVYDAQGVFRLLLNSMAEPGLIARLEDVLQHPDTLGPATYAVALTLFDQDTGIHITPNMDHPDTQKSLYFHTAADLTQSIEQADFVISNENDRPDLSELNAGSEAYPDQSCTLIIQCESFFKGIVYRASGPGIETTRKIRCSAFNGTLLHQRDKLASRFPLGIDLILTCGNEFFCIPRTTRLVVEQN